VSDVDGATYMRTQLWIAPYELSALQPLNRHRISARKGFLIKIQSADIEQGYADCHPLREFGDKSVEEYVSELRSRKISTHLLKKSISFAKQDGRAREEKRRLFSELPVKSHYTCTAVQLMKAATVERCLKQGFTTIKVKVGVDPEAEARQLSRLPLGLFSQVRWRFDANSQGGELFLKALPQEHLEFIDFIEDPCRFGASRWKAIERKYGVSCAFDRPEGKAASYKHFSGVRVIKPARDDVRARSRDVITNCMDHPVGQSMAFWTAQHAVSRWAKQKMDYGLQTHHLFKTDAFFAQIKTDGPYFKTSDDGYGVGFTQSLKRIKWQSL
jgi:O-succinylbenzoate synthase